MTAASAGRRGSISPASLRTAGLDSLVPSASGTRLPQARPCGPVVRLGGVVPEAHVVVPVAVGAVAAECGVPPSCSCVLCFPFPLFSFLLLQLIAGEKREEREEGRKGGKFKVEGRLGGALHGLERNYPSHYFVNL